MAPVMYRCPECSASLKTPQALPAGKKIRCPKCSTVFEVEGLPGDADAPPNRPNQAAAKTPEESDASYGVVSEKPSTAPTDSELKSGKRRPDSDDADDQDDDYDDDDRPVKKKKKGFKKKKVSGDGSLVKVYVLLLVAMLVLFLGGGGAGAYLYFNWYKNKGTGNEDLLAMLPADSWVVFSLNLGNLTNSPDGVAIADEIYASANTNNVFREIKAEAGIEYKDLFDRIYLSLRPALPGNPNPPGAMVLKSRVRFDQNKMRAAFKDCTPVRSNGKTYLRLKQEGNGFVIAYMPSDWILVLSDGPEASFVNTLSANPTEPGIAADVLAMIKNVEKDDFWAAGAIDESMRRNIQQAPAAPGMGIPPGVKAAMAKAKSFSAGMSLENGQLKVTASLNCSDDVAAKQMSDGLGALWNQQKGMLSIMAGAAGKDGAAIIKDLTQSLRFASQGANAKATAQLGFQAMKENFLNGIRTARMGALQGGAGPFPGAQPGGPPPGAPRGKRRP